MGTQVPQKKGTAPTQFSAHVYCGQTADWMNTPLGTEVDLGPGHIVLDGDAAPPPAKGAQQPPSFRPMSMVATVAHLSYCELLYNQNVATKVKTAWMARWLNGLGVGLAIKRSRVRL